MRRAAGTGQVEQLPSGKYRVRLVVDGLRRTLGVYDTREEADAVLAEARRLVASGEARPTSGTTVRGWLEEWRDSRQRENRWPHSYDFALAHLVAASWARTPLVHLRSDEIRDWLHDFARTPLARTGRAPTHGSAQLVWTVLRVALVEAVEAKRIPTAPIVGVRMPERASREEPWTFLTPAEQLRVIAAFPDEEDRDIVAFAIGSGLRAGELVSLELADVRLGAAPQIVVRFGGQRHAPTKNRKTRVVPLFGLALAAVRRQVERLRGGQRNDRGLLWPNQVGSWRPRHHVLGHVGHRRKPYRTSVGRWQHVVRALDLGRPVRWHDLRHTCASSLVAGWWGRAWRLEEVRDLLGHSSVDQTEIYAHLATSVLSDAAAQTTGIEADDVGFARSPREAHATRNAANMLAIAMPTPSSMERVVPSNSADFGASVGFAWGSPALRDLVVEALSACAQQQPGAVERAREAVRAVVAARVAADEVLAAASAAESRGVAGLVEVLSQALRELAGTAARRGRR